MPEATPAGAERSDFYVVEAAEPAIAAAKILAVVRERIPRAFGLDPIRDIQVLCPMNRGGVGARSLNIELQKVLNPPSEVRVERFGWTYAPGDKVMQIENDYDKEVYSGDLGIVARIDMEAGDLVATFDGREVVYAFGELDELVLAYATTIHKAQGSEYPAVVIPVMTQHYTMLARNLLYTGVTRSKKLVVLVGQRKAIAMAVDAGVCRSWESGCRYEVPGGGSFAARLPRPFRRRGRRRMRAPWVGRVENGLMRTGRMPIPSWPRGLCHLQRSIDRGPADAELGGDLQRFKAFGLQLAHLSRVDRGHPTLVDAGSLGLGNALELALLAQVGFELGEHPQHVEEGLAGGGAGIDGLLGGAQRDASGLEGAHDILQVADGPGQAVDPRHHQLITGPHEVHEGGKLRTALASGARHLLGPDHRAARGTERGILDRKVLVGGGNASVAIEVAGGGHRGASSSHMGLDRLFLPSQKAEINPIESRGRRLRALSHGGILMRGCTGRMAWKRSCVNHS